MARYNIVASHFGSSNIYENDKYVKNIRKAIFSLFVLFSVPNAKIFLIKILKSTLIRDGLGHMLNDIKGIFFKEYLKA